ncbi:peptidoglycan-binding protein [Candidatus Kaiserbacteria bacterium]|nr:peptidoglycan-binding protein [Candidatus Kaiserbacteria bacterium]
MRKIFFALFGACALLPVVAFAEFTIDLKQGDSGQPVVELQNFLITQTHLAAYNNTGFFGPLTLAGVKAFQTAQNISPASGFFGPLTRAAANSLLQQTTQQNQCPVVGVPSCQGGILEPLGVDAKGCQIGYRCVGGTGAQSGTALTASPTSGQAPLFVTFSYSTANLTGGSLTLYFGDGDETDVAVTSQGGTTNHAYTQPGTYTAVLSSGGTVVASANVTVNACTGSNCAKPNSCPALDQLRRILRQGMSGNDVSALQDYLAEFPNIYPEKLTTGYFGSATEKAVQRWQTARAIASSGSPESTGWGVVGPKTIKAMREACNLAGLPSNLAANSDTPGSQTITLAVGQIIFVGGTNVKFDSMAENSASLIEIPIGGSIVSQYFSESAILSVNEQVTFNGATITLKEINSTTQRATFLIAANPNALSVAATPDTGPAPLTVSISVSPWFPNGYTLDFGDGMDAVTCDSSCGNTKSFARSYAKNGTYTVSLKNASGETVKTATVKVEGNGQNVPVISSYSPTSAYPGDTVKMKGKYLTGINSILVEGTLIGVFAASDVETLDFVIPNPFPKGSYGLVVSNVNGTSASVSITILGPKPPPVSSASEYCTLNGVGYPIEPAAAKCTNPYGNIGDGIKNEHLNAEAQACQKYYLGAIACIQQGWIGQSTAPHWGTTRFACISSNGVFVPASNGIVSGNKCRENADISQRECITPYACRKDGWWEADMYGNLLEKVNPPWIWTESP